MSQPLRSSSGLPDWSRVGGWRVRIIRKQAALIERVTGRPSHHASLHAAARGKKQKKEIRVVVSLSGYLGRTIGRAGEREDGRCVLSTDGRR